MCWRVFLVGSRGGFAHDGADHLRPFRRILAVAAPVGSAAAGFVYLLHRGRIGWQRPPKIWQVVLARLARQLDYLGLAATFLAAVMR